MSLVIYSACFATALCCAAILARAFTRSRHPLLLWAALCFAALAVNEALVIVHVYVVPGTSLLTARRVAGFLAAALMVGGLILHDRGRGE